MGIKPMNMDKHLDVINACRYCFMCRHLAPLALVTGKETDTPRGRALIADQIRMNKENLKNQDYVQALYQADLSGACRTHCVSSYDEVGLVLELRKDIVDAGVQPQAVKDFAQQFINPSFTITGEGDVLYFNHPCIKVHAPEMKAAFDKLAPKHKTIEGNDCGTALQILGYQKQADEAAEKFVKAVKESGCKTLVVPQPAAFHFIKSKNLLPDVKVLNTAEFLLTLDIPKKSGTLWPIDSDFLKNYQKNNAPRKLLEKLGYKLKEFGITHEESYTCGEGSMTMVFLYPENVAKLVERVREFAERYEAGTLVVASPYTKLALRTYAPELDVISVEEAAAR